jgi:hypothetical protein
MAFVLKRGQMSVCGAADDTAFMFTRIIRVTWRKEAA